MSHLVVQRLPNHNDFVSIAICHESNHRFAGLEVFCVNNNGQVLTAVIQTVC